MSASVDTLFLDQGAPYVARTRVVSDTGWYRRADFTSFFIVSDGVGQMRVRDERRSRQYSEALRPGKVYFLSPRDVTDIVGEPRIQFVAFPTADWKAFAGLARMTPRRDSFEGRRSVGSAQSDVDVEATFDETIRKFDASPRTIDLIDFWVRVTPLFLDSTEEAQAREPSWLTRSLSGMEDEENLRRGVRRLAELAHVSRSHLAATTRKCYQQTPIGLVMEMRLRRAAFLLRNEDEPVAVIAHRCGFATAAHFSNRFREAYGVSPREYRKGGG